MRDAAEGFTFRVRTMRGLVWVSAEAADGKGLEQWIAVEVRTTRCHAQFKRC
jgi:hypothetical protein